jgi:hypothetical protein
LPAAIKPETVPDRLTEAARLLEEARKNCLDAAKALDSDLIPTLPYKRDVLFAADACHQAEQDVFEFYDRLKS